MPSLFRFLTIVCLLCLAGFGLVWVLANYVTPATRPMRVEVSLPQLQNKPGK